MEIKFLTEIEPTCVSETLATVASIMLLSENILFLFPVT